MIIYQYPINNKETEIFTYRNGKVLSVGEIGTNLVVWIACDIDEAPIVRTFVHFATSEVVTGALLKYVGTIVCASGSVRHVFEVL